MKRSLCISNFLEEISSLSHSIVFLYFFALIPEEGFLNLFLLFFGTLHSDPYIFPFLLCLSLLFFSQLFVRPPQTAILLFLHFFSMGMVLIPVSCKMSGTFVHSLSGTLCSNYCTIALISHASKVMLKSLHARLQQYMNHELPDVQAGFRKGRGKEIKLPTSAG